MIGRTTLSSLPYLRNYKSMRASSWDRTGGNRDFITVKNGDKATLFETEKPGCVKHIWMTVGGGGPHFLRRIVLRMWWDGEKNPSVEAPLGDFFGIGFSKNKDFVSLPLQASPQDGRGMNCWWPMPFDAARIEIENQTGEEHTLYFYIDYEEYESAISNRQSLPESQSEIANPQSEIEIARFHCQFRRENPTQGWGKEKLNDKNIWEIWSRHPNLDGKDNYVILEAEGSGVYCGCVMHVDCYNRQPNDWYGEGDDMIFIDGEPWPPRLHGTGTEDYFNMAFCPRTEYCAPYHGLPLYSGSPTWPWKGKNSMYRFHIEDPIRFEKSIKVTIEHGTSNKLSNDYSSTAYWYQLEPHKAFPKLPATEDRLPRPDEQEFA